MRKMFLCAVLVMMCVSSAFGDATVDLFKGAEEGHADAAEVLLKNRADVNAKDNKGRTALMMAIRSDHADVAEVLLKNEADVNAKDNDGWTALMWAAIRGHADATEVLIKYGADVSAKDSYFFGKTAIDYANNDEIKRILLNAAK